VLNVELILLHNATQSLHGSSFSVSWLQITQNIRTTFVASSYSLIWSAVKCEVGCKWLQESSAHVKGSVRPAGHLPSTRYGGLLAGVGTKLK
jgi:hypothetical protein